MELWALAANVATIIGTLAAILSLVITLLDRWSLRAAEAPSPPSGSRSTLAKSPRATGSKAIAAKGLYPPAPLIKRGMAYAIDSFWLFLSAGIGLVLVLGTLLTDASFSRPGSVSNVVTGYVLMLAGLGTFLIGWALAGVSPGKYMLGIRICTLDGNRRIGWRRALVRLLGFLFTGFISVYVVRFNKRRRALHDLMAGTYVCELPDGS